jgi:hypothetical protein
MWRRVSLVRTDASEERIASIIRVTRIGELGTTLAVTSDRSTLWKGKKNLRSVLPLFLAGRFLSPWWWRRYVPQKRRFLEEPHGVTSQTTEFFIVTAVKTSYLRNYVLVSNFINVNSSRHIVSLGIFCPYLLLQGKITYKSYKWW